MLTCPSRFQSFADLESSSNSSSSFDLERRTTQATIINSNSNSCSSLNLQPSDVPSTLPTSLLMSPILTNIITSSKTVDRNTRSPFANASHASKSLEADLTEEPVPIHMDYLEFDVNESPRFQNGKRPPSSSELTNISEPAKRMRMVNSADVSRENSNGRMVPVDGGNKNNVLDDVTPLNEPQYIVDDGDQVVYINEGQMNRSSDMTGIENETVEALMQSLSPYEFSFNEMGQLMITEPIFENEDPTASAQESNAIISDDVVADQQLSECNITTDDLDDIDQLVAPILENSEGKVFHLKFNANEPTKVAILSEILTSLLLLNATL